MQQRLAGHGDHDEHRGPPARRHRQGQDGGRQRHRDHLPRAAQHPHGPGHLAAQLGAVLREEPDHLPDRPAHPGGRQHRGDEQAERRQHAEDGGGRERQPPDRRPPAGQDRLSGPVEVQPGVGVGLQGVEGLVRAQPRAVLPAAEGRGGHAQPRRPQGPAGQDVGDEVHAQGEPGEADRQHDERREHDEPGARGAPRPAGARAAAPRRRRGRTSRARWGSWRRSAPRRRGRRRRGARGRPAPR